MNKVVKMVAMALVLTVVLTLAVAGAAFAGPGPAPYSGDGIPDGPGWDDPVVGVDMPYGPNGIGAESEPIGPKGYCDGSCQQ